MNKETMQKLAEGVTAIALEELKKQEDRLLADAGHWVLNNLSLSDKSDIPKMFTGKTQEKFEKMLGTVLENDAAIKELSNKEGSK